MFVAIFTYITSLHALGQVHIYAMNQDNRKITKVETIKCLDGKSSEIQDQTFKIKQNHAQRFFVKEDFKTPLF